MPDWATVMSIEGCPVRLADLVGEADVRLLREAASAARSDKNLPAILA